MIENEAGFIYPKVQEELCVNCGMCKSVYVFNKKGFGENKEPEVFAGVINDRETLKNPLPAVFFRRLQMPFSKRGELFSVRRGKKISRFLILSLTAVKNLKNSEVQSMFKVQ